MEVNIRHTVSLKTPATKIRVRVSLWIAPPICAIVLIDRMGCLWVKQFQMVQISTFRPNLLPISLRGLARWSWSRFFRPLKFSTTLTFIAFSFLWTRNFCSTRLICNNMLVMVYLQGGRLKAVAHFRVRPLMCVQFARTKIVRPLMCVDMQPLKAVHVQPLINDRLYKK